MSSRSTTTVLAEYGQGVKTTTVRVTSFATLKKVPAAPSAAQLLFRCCAVLTLFTTGCDRNSEGNKPATSKNESPGQGTPSKEKSEKPEVAERLDALPEKDIRAVVDKWLAAQNSGNFEDYKKLFAERFEGLKRVGSRQESFDRETWLADRAKMFERDFTVTVDDVQIAASGAAAVVQFVQTWTSATFQDKGPKRLIVARGKDGLQIAKEEMLQSNLAGQNSSKYKPDVRQFAFVWDDLLIVDELKSLTGVTGHPAPTSNNTTSRPVVARLLPERERSLLEEEFVLYGTNGKLCTTRAKGFRVHVEVQPHFGQEQHWSGFEGAPKVSAQQRALQLWELSEMGGRFLALELEMPPACGGALWARSAKLPPPTLWKSRKPTEEEEKKILQAARSQSSYREEQAAYEGQTGRKVPWEETKGGSSRILVFEGPAGAQYADVSMFHEGGGCGANYAGIFWAMVRKKGNAYVNVNAGPGQHVDSSWPRMDKTMRSDAAFDLDGDGIPEFYGGYDLIKSENGTFRAVYNQSPSNFDCPC